MLNASSQQAKRKRWLSGAGLAIPFAAVLVGGCVSQVWHNRELAAVATVEQTRDCWRLGRILLVASAEDGRQELRRETMIQARKLAWGIGADTVVINAEPPDAKPELQLYVCR